MATRREIKDQHETAVIEAAVRAHNDHVGRALKVVAKPDPPDAVLEDDKGPCWLEHTDAFYPGWARDLTSFAAADKKHEPMAGGVHVGMDQTFAEIFVDVVLAKFHKGNYQALVAQYGPGILVVGLETPWLGNDTLEAIDRAWAGKGADLGAVFSHVYLGYRQNGENHAFLWRPPRR